MSKKQAAAIDWAAIEMKYRTSGLSLRTIGAEYGVTEGAIRKRAKNESWARDLREKVRAATDSLLLRKTSTQDVRTEQQAIKVEAEIQSNIVLGHRRGLVRLKTIRDKLLDHLEASVDFLPDMPAIVESLRKEDDKGQDKRNDLLYKTLDRPQIVDDFKKLVDVDEKIRKGEREAFGIGDGDSDKSSVDDLLAKVIGTAR